MVHVSTAASYIAVYYSVESSDYLTVRVYVYTYVYMHRCREEEKEPKSKAKKSKEKEKKGKERKRKVRTHETSTQSHVPLYPHAYHSTAESTQITRYGIDV